MHCILFFSYFIKKSNSQLVLYYYKIYMYNKTETYILKMINIKYSNFLVYHC